MRSRNAFVAVVLLALAVTPALADKGDVILRFGVTQTMPTGDLTETEGTETFKLEADDTAGFGGSVEFMATDLVGISTGLSYANPDVDLGYSAPALSGSVTIGEASMTPLTVAANFHVKKTDKVDFYIGPELGYVFYGDLEVDLPDVPDVEIDEIGDIDLDDDFAFGANMGLDVPFNERWMFCTRVEFLKTAAKPDDGGGDMDIDPWTIGVGVGVKF